MTSQETNDVDPCLRPFLEAPDETTTERELNKLFAESNDRIRHIVSRKLQVSLHPQDGRFENQEALEVISNVQALLFTALRRLKDGTSPKPIRNFEGYVAVATYHACYQELREKYPQRWRLKNKIRYLATHRPALKLWEDPEGRLLCDLSDRDQTGKHDLGVSDQRRELPDDIVRPFSENPLQPGPLTELIVRILEHSGRAVELDDLVNIVADACGVEEHSSHAVTGDAFEYAHEPVDNRTSVATTLERRVELEQLWSEILEMPLRHRAAILLNLRDAEGRGVISLFPRARIATIRQIAEALEFPLELFAEVWNELPWDDVRIAQHLGLSRQQVINLRHSARARLMRRLKRYSGSPNQLKTGGQ